MGKFRDLRNQTFGRLTVIVPTEKRTHRHVIWQCRCDCGTVVEVNSDSLARGLTRSCGCLQMETRVTNGKITGKINYKFAAEANRKYPDGETETNLYNDWKNMNNRCYNPNNPEYHRYGGRGIMVCDEWKDFKRFKADAILHGYREGCGLTIDRIDNDGDYTPDNCQWITKSENSRKRWTDQKKKRESSRPGKQSTLDGTPAASA